MADEQPAEPVWGTGYGSKRHLVDPATRQAEPRRRFGRDRYALAQCSSQINLSYFSDGPGADEGVAVMKKPACPRCAKKAGLTTCPTCEGRGTVETPTST